MRGQRGLVLAASLGAALGCAVPLLAQPAAPSPPVVSPYIGADRDVTLRLRAPAAERVELVSGGDIPGVPMARATR